jgi:PadR family transcriptional regulator, regulatory protein PadR
MYEEGLMNSTDQWLVQLRKGVLELLILRQLAISEEMHGYAIVKKLSSIELLDAGESTIYPILRRLESDGLLKSRWVKSVAGPPRKYYCLTVMGVSFLEDANQKWAQIVETMTGSQQGAPS